MSQPIYVLLPWAALLVFVLARYGLGRHGALAHALALLATLAVVYLAIRPWLLSLSAADAFASVGTIMSNVDRWWEIYLYQHWWPWPVLAYFGACCLLALPFALWRRRAAKAVRSDA